MTISSRRRARPSLFTVALALMCSLASISGTAVLFAAQAHIAQA